MEQISTEINQLNTKINDIEQLLGKDFEEWTATERNKFGNHAQLRKEEEQLRELLILLQNQRLQGIEKLTSFSKYCSTSRPVYKK